MAESIVASLTFYFYAIIWNDEVIWAEEITTSPKTSLNWLEIFEGSGYHPPPMSERTELIARLESAHAFPGPYTFRIIGDNHPDFPEAVENALSGFVIQESTKKLSKNGNHLSLNMKVIAPTPDAVLDAYEVLGGLELVRYVL